MTPAIEALYTNTIEKLSNEAAYASEMMRRFSRIDITDSSFKVVATDKRYERYSEYRLSILRYLAQLRKWTVEEFFYAFHNNENDLQSVIFGTPWSAYWQ